MTDLSPSGVPSARDRRAVERVEGRSLPEEWPPDALPAGTRVTVVRDPEWGGPWRYDFLGTIDGMGAPEPVVHPRSRVGELAYWVTFDTPQYDCDGDGPYRKAQIWSRYLRPETPPTV